jgi:hypothetical protein
MSVVAMDGLKPKEKVGEVLQKQKLEKIAYLEQKFGVVVDVENIDLGNLADLQDTEVTFKRKLEIIQGMLTQGEARSIKLLQMEEFMEIITLKIEVRTNPL